MAINNCKAICCLACVVVLLAIIIPMMAALDMFKKIVINDGGCLRVDGPRGMEDQTYWNKDVLLAGQKDGMFKIKPKLFKKT